MNRKTASLTLLGILSLAHGPLEAQKASTAIVDYREWQSPIRNQEARGTCTAFAIVAAMETFPGTPIDLSEQYIYAWAKMNHYKEMAGYSQGAPLSFYADVIRDKGTVTEDREPYNPHKPIWTTDADAFEAMKSDIQADLYSMLTFPDYSYRLNWDLLSIHSDATARDVDWIKARLDEGVRAVPVGYSISGNHWSPHPASEEQMISPEDFILAQLDGKMVPFAEAKRRVPDLIEKFHRNEVAFSAIDTSLVPKGGHAVAIVGYNADGFLIKNSWGTTWGESGYGWVSFDYHRIFASEALVLRGLKFQPGLGGEDKVWNPDAFQLKVTPYHYENKVFNQVVDGAELSLVWTGAGRPLALSEVNYKVYDSEGGLVEEKAGYVKGIYEGEGTKMGYPASMLDGKVGPQSGEWRIEVTATAEDGRSFKRTFKVQGRETHQYP